MNNLEKYLKKRIEWLKFNVKKIEYGKPTKKAKIEHAFVSAMLFQCQDILKELKKKGKKS